MIDRYTTGLMENGGGAGGIKNVCGWRTKKCMCRADPFVTAPALKCGLDLLDAPPRGGVQGG
jgi:hypothetical protein